jgi:hypothetical protein
MGDGRWLALGAVAAVAAAGAWRSAKHGSSYEVIQQHASGDRDWLSYGGGSLLRYQDGQFYWVVLEGTDVYPQDMRLERMESYVENNGIELDHELDPQDDEDLHRYFRREVYEVEVEDDLRWIFDEHGKTRVEVAQQMIDNIGVRDTFEAEELVELAHSPEPVQRLVVLELYGMQVGMCELDWETEAMTGAEIVERWPHFGGKVARHSFRGITWIEPWKHR